MTFKLKVTTEQKINISNNLLNQTQTKRNFPVKQNGNYRKAWIFILMTIPFKLPNFTQSVLAYTTLSYKLFAC